MTKNYICMHAYVHDFFNNSDNSHHLKLWNPLTEWCIENNGYFSTSLVQLLQYPAG